MLIISKSYKIMSNPTAVLLSEWVWVFDVDISPYWCGYTESNAWVSKTVHWDYGAGVHVDEWHGGLQEPEADDEEHEAEVIMIDED